MLDISFNLKRALTVGSIILLVAFIAIYGYRNSRSLLRGVPLALDFPTPDTTLFTESTIRVEGLAPNARELQINGNSLVIDQRGRFSEDFVLMPGHNKVTILAVDKYDKVSQIKRTWYYSKEDTSMPIPQSQLQENTEIENENDIIETEQSIESQPLLLN